MRKAHVIFAVVALAAIQALSRGQASKEPPATSSAAISPQPAVEAPVASAGNCLSITEAGKHIRKQACVKGIVVRVEENHGVTFLDFCADYRTCPFTVVVFPSDMRQLGDVRQLQGREVRIHGKIEEYDDRAEIVLRHPQQLGDEGKVLTAIPKDYDVERRGHYSAGSFRAAKTKKPSRKAQGPPVPIIDVEEQ
ncbi:MAG TPA: hypothetical protein VMT67_11835 [Terriglobales bacterium]|nr:hypothetical protein [Terriglobales bacterium]